MSGASKGYAVSWRGGLCWFVPQGARDWTTARIRAVWPHTGAAPALFASKTGDPLRKGYALQSDRKIHMKILCISDQVERMLYGPNLTSYARGVEAVISCGDLPFDYLEYIVTFLGVPVYYVLGNHDPGPEGPEYPGGCTPLDGRVVEAEGEGGGVVLAGLSGSPLYSGGPNQYTERHMRRRARTLSVRIRCRSLVGRPKPEIFATHSPPFGLGDQDDMAHVGFESFVDLIDRHEPPLWLHGHVHLYGPDQERVRQKGDTKIVNVYGHRILDV
ncbi:MAG TPA: metallophosphoesterase [Rubrobacter sp.]|nr:metallophosphoesterase [Rubrobacter sp.]